MIIFRPRAALAASLIALAALMAGCSATPSQQPTAAIAPAKPADATALPGADGQVVAGQGESQPTTGKGKVPVATAFAVPVEKLDCDQMKAELDLFAADETAKKLEQYGKAKYLPNAAEAANFNRLVAVKQASAERCKAQKKTGKKSAKKAVDKTAGLVKKPKVIDAPVETVKATVEKVPAETISATEMAE